MKYLIILSILALSACGSSTPPPQNSGNFPIMSRWKATSAPAVLGDSIDFSNLVLNGSVASTAILNCDGSYGNSGSVNGVVSGQVRTTGLYSHGTIQFGNTAYVGATDSRCRDASKEAYSYDVDNINLTICLVNLSYPFCTTYQADLTL